MKNEWKYVVNPGKFNGAIAAILIDGKSPYTGKTEKDFIAEGFDVIDESEYEKRNAEYENSLCNQWKEITEDEYENALNVLPPEKWRDGGFFSSEHYTGSITAFYQRFNGKFYTSLQSTYTPRAVILENLMRHIAWQEANGE